MSVIADIERLERLLAQVSQGLAAVKQTLSAAPRRCTGAAGFAVASG